MNISGGYFPDDRSMNFPIYYLCNCIDRNIDLEDEVWFSDKIEDWKQCESSQIWSGYFQKYRSPFFNHFLELLQLCEQNSDCRCYWPEESSQMRKILDEIFTSFLDLENPDINEAEICNLFALHWYDSGLYSIDTLVVHLSHSFLYSQMRYCQKLCPGVISASSKIDFMLPFSPLLRP